MRTVDLRAEATNEARRLSGARALIRDGDERALAQLEGAAAWIALPRRSRLRRSLGRRICLVWRVALEDASGRTIESRLVPVLIDLPSDAGRVPSDPPPTRRARIRSVLQEVDTLLSARVEAACEEWTSAATRVTGAFTSARLAREEEIARLPPLPRVASQPGLFDRRAERTRQAEAAANAEFEQDVLARLRAIAGGGTIARRPARLLLALVP